MIGRYRTSGIPLPAPILTAGLLLAGSAVRAETSVRFFVSTQGDDAWSGRLDVPNARGQISGPYKGELRASWPIVEAPGAREHPVKPPR